MVFFLMQRRPPKSTRTDTLFPTRRSSDLLEPRHPWQPDHGADARRDGDAQHPARAAGHDQQSRRSEEHTSELQSLMRISYAVFCLKKKKKNTNATQPRTNRDCNTTRTNTTKAWQNE